jgi:hypothetical protein
MTFPPQERLNHDILDFDALLAKHKQCGTQFSKYLERQQPLQISLLTAIISIPHSKSHKLLMALYINRRFCVRLPSHKLRRWRNRASMARDVGLRLGETGEEIKAWSDVEVEGWKEGLKRRGKWREDVWG